jgi:hypothetical protein
VANKAITDKKDTYPGCLGEQGAKHPTSLVAAEMAVEGNYNMVGDGILNNIPKPSMLERLNEFERKKKERHKDDFLDSKQERHREARHSQDER